MRNGLLVYFGDAGGRTRSGCRSRACLPTPTSAGADLRRCARCPNVPPRASPRRRGLPGSPATPTRPPGRRAPPDSTVRGAGERARRSDHRRVGHRDAAGNDGRSDEEAAASSTTEAPPSAAGRGPAQARESGTAGRERESRSGRDHRKSGAQGAAKAPRMSPKSQLQVEAAGRAIPQAMVESSAICKRILRKWSLIVDRAKFPA